MASSVQEPPVYTNNGEHLSEKDQKQTSDTQIQKIENDSNNFEILNINSATTDDLAFDQYGERDPTDEEKSTLPRVSASIPWACWLVALVELCERFAYYGLTGPFQNYMQYSQTDHTKGALNLGSQGASALSYFFQFWCYCTPVFGAWVSDTFWGKYKTIVVFASIYMFGILILFLTSLPVSIRNGHAKGGFIAAIIIIGLGTGGVKSNVSPLIADQIPDRGLKVTERKGKLVLIDPQVTIQSVFMFFYLCINIGSLSAIATTELEHNVAFWAAFLLPFLFFIIGIVALILGKNVYVKNPPSKSTINNAFKITYTAIKNKFDIQSAKPSVRPEANYPWTDLFVDEVSRSIKACKVFLFYPIYWVVYGQMLNNFVSQASTMETHGLPNDIMQNIDPIAIIIFIPIIEKLLYPGLRKIGIKFKPITRITWGFLFAALSMAYAAIIQHVIYTSGPCYDAPLACAASNGGSIPNHVHIAIQTPAYFLIAISEIFTSITGLEYAYTKAPASMKSFIMSLFLISNAFGAAIGIALSPTSKDPKLVWTYTGLSVATLIAGFAFYLTFRHYNNIEEKLNTLKQEYVKNGLIPVDEDLIITESKDIEDLVSSNNGEKKEYELTAQFSNRQAATIDTIAISAPPV